MHRPLAKSLTSTENGIVNANTSRGIRNDIGAFLIKTVTTTKLSGLAVLDE